MSKSDKNLSQIISEAQITILDSNESIYEDRPEENSSFMKDALLAKCRDTIETLYTEIESQKRQRREAELTSRETLSTVQNLEKRLKESNSRLISLQEENEKLSEQIDALKKSLKQTDKASVVNKVREELQDEISALRMQIIEKNSVIQDLNAGNKMLETKVNKLEHENFRCNEELEDTQSKLEDAIFKCDRLAAQAKITETVTANLKQAQEDYTRYIKEGKECYESKEQELKEKFEMLESRLKKRYQAKELQLKQEVKESIEEIQRSLEINDSEHLKIRSENLQLKENIRHLNEKFSENEHNLRAQIEKLELDLQNSLMAIREKTNLLERSETHQKLEKNKQENYMNREKELESQIKALEDKCKMCESKNLDAKKIIDGLNSEILGLKGEVLKENNKVGAKELEIKEGLERERELNIKINKLKNEKIEEGNKHSKELQDKIESTGNLIKQQVLREFEGKIEDFKAKISELQAENKMLKLKIEQYNGDTKKMRNRERQVYDTKESCNDEALYEELNIIKSKLAKMTSLKNAAEQKLSGVKDEFSALEEKIKQDSSFFRNETMRKDEELMRMKKKFENKLREIYAENSITTEQIRTDLLRLHSEVRNRDLKDSGYWLSKSLEDLMKRIPSY